MKKKIDRQDALVRCAAEFYSRHWMWGTSGNLSVRLGSDPLRMAITASGVNKGELKRSDLLVLEDGRKPSKNPRGLAPSAETEIHQAIYRSIPSANAVFHVHAMYATLVSAFHGDPEKISFAKLEWFEMMKGVGVGEGDDREVVIFPNNQDISKVAQDVTDYLSKNQKPLPVILIYNHGMTAWGATPDQAKNHLEIMEYVCQYLYLKHQRFH